MCGNGLRGLICLPVALLVAGCTDLFGQYRIPAINTGADISNVPAAGIGVE